MPRKRTPGGKGTQRSKRSTMSRGRPREIPPHADVERPEAAEIEQPIGERAIAHEGAPIECTSPAPIETRCTDEGR